MGKFVLVLGTSHRLQGADKGRNQVDDPSYAKLLEALITSESIDFILEEAAKLGPTTAERLALSHWGPRHYLDADPSAEERAEYGIGDKSGEAYPIDRFDPVNSKDMAEWELLQPHTGREELWLERVKGIRSNNALFICGCIHTLSFAFRLRREGFDVKAIQYLPHHKLG